MDICSLSLDITELMSVYLPQSQPDFSIDLRSDFADIVGVSDDVDQMIGADVEFAADSKVDPETHVLFEDLLEITAADESQDEERAKVFVGEQAVDVTCDACVQTEQQGPVMQWPTDWMHSYARVALRFTRAASMSPRLDVEESIMTTKQATAAASSAKMMKPKPTIMSGEAASKSVKKIGRRKRVRDRSTANAAVKKSRAKSRQAEEDEEQLRQALRSQNRHLLSMVRVKGLLSDSDHLQAFVQEAYPEDMRPRVHDQRPHRRAKAETDAERKEREREVNRESSRRNALRHKWDAQERVKEISFLGHQNKVMQLVLKESAVAEQQLMSMCGPRSPVRVNEHFVSVGDFAKQADDIHDSSNSHMDVH